MQLSSLAKGELIQEIDKIDTIDEIKKNVLWRLSCKRAFLVTIQRDLAFFIGFVETHGRASLHYARQLN